MTRTCFRSSVTRSRSRKVNHYWPGVYTAVAHFDHGRYLFVATLVGSVKCGHVGWYTRVRYAAVGDSFTEGYGDFRENGSVIGWADRVALGLARMCAEPVYYSNHAIRGRRLADIATEQVSAVLELDPLPDLVTINGGANDLLHPRHHSVAHLIDVTHEAIERLKAAGVLPVIMGPPDPSQNVPFSDVVRARGKRLSKAQKKIAKAHGTLFINIFKDKVLQNPEYWAHDRVHLNEHGHARVANRVLTEIGFSAVDELIAPDPIEFGRNFRTEAKYFRQVVFPWVGRYFTGRSTGEGRSGKYLEWTEVSPSLRL